MSKSIVSNNKRCLVCNSTYNLHKHHVYEGTANRKKSEKYGCWVYLCAKHHNMSNDGVHFNKNLDLRIKQLTENKFLENHTLNEFISIFGRNYL